MTNNLCLIPYLGNGCLAARTHRAIEEVECQTNLARQRSPHSHNQVKAQSYPRLCTSNVLRTWCRLLQMGRSEGLRLLVRHTYPLSLDPQIWNGVRAGRRSNVPAKGSSEPRERPTPLCPVANYRSTRRLTRLMMVGQ